LHVPIRQSKSISTTCRGGQARVIVIVDDNADSSEALLRLLRHHGYDALSCADGVEALTYLHERENPALMILDFNMPDMSGHDLLRVMRENARWRGIPVLVYTAEASEQARNESLRIGAQTHLTKGSADWERLFAEIRRLAGAPA
jgi:CheY-like chemotaxis protein